MRRPSILISSLLLVVGCSGSEPSVYGSEPLTDELTQSIIGGTAASTCQFPTTVVGAPRAGVGCSATLVHPRLVTLAAHCFGNPGAPKTIDFGESRTSPARSVGVERCEAHPEFSGVGNEHDVAYCVLKEPVNDVPIAPPLMGCETDILKVGQKVYLVGFGARSAGEASEQSKHWVETTVTKAPAGNTVVLGTSTKTACTGDSGGSAFVQLDDGSYRAFGITSSGSGEHCGSPTVYVLIHKWAAWIEQESGVDITPCHDADGTWNPSSSCTSFAMNPPATGLSWSSGCAGTLSGPSTTCGDNGTNGGGGSPGSGGSAGTSGSAGSAGAGEAGSGGSGEGGSSGEGGGSGSDGTSGSAGAVDMGGAAGAGAAANGGNPSSPSAGGGGTAANGGSSGRSGGSAAAAGDENGDVPTDSSDDGGCSCRVASPSSRSPLLGLLTAVGLAFARRRRR